LSPRIGADLRPRRSAETAELQDGVNDARSQRIRSTLGNADPRPSVAVSPRQSAAKVVLCVIRDP
ncbi:hypothetical protein Q8G39_28850, partial [Klebsiella pneumoniae]|uniref:hypothetical protein n=1 Tax=Klebsiella pneumoniae TaxID=573 RepID=UPI003014025E